MDLCKRSQMSLLPVRLALIQPRMDRRKVKWDFIQHRACADLGQVFQQISISKMKDELVEAGSSYCSRKKPHK